MCRFCDKNTMRSLNNIDDSVCSVDIYMNKNLDLVIENEEINEIFEFNFCPVCGKKLRENSIGDEVLLNGFYEGGVKNETMNKNVRVFRVTDCECFVTAWGIKRFVNWYNKNFGEKITEEDIEICDLDNNFVYLSFKEVIDLHKREITEPELIAFDD